MLSLQVEFGIPVELPLFYVSPGWRDCKSVLDIGTGNGHYVEELTRRFIDKRFLCIEPEDRYFDMAQSRFRRLDLETFGTVTLLKKDIFEVEGQFDFVLARLLVQHIENVRLTEFIAKIRSLLNQKGHFLVIDSIDSERFFWPASELFDRFFFELSSFCDKTGYSRDNGAKIQEMSQKLGLDIVLQRKVYCASTVLRNKQVFSESYGLFFDIVRDQYGMPFDYDALQKDLLAWQQNNRSYCQIVLEGTMYRKR